MKPEELALILQQLEPDLPTLVGGEVWTQISSS